MAARLGRQFTLVLIMMLSFSVISFSQNQIKFSLDGAEKLDMKLNALGDLRFEYKGDASSSQNLFIGQDAGTFTLHNSDIDGYYNTVVGNRAFYLNTTGHSNTVMGRFAMHTNGTGYRNVAVGEQAMQVNFTGFKNVSLGAFALHRNSAGSGNVAVGDSTLSVNTEGVNNVAIGLAAMRSNIDGQQNVAIGPNTLGGNANGNTAIGSGAMSNNESGFINTAIGSAAMFSNTNGFHNTAIGTGSLFFNTDGARNVALGRLALYHNKSNARSTAIGYAAMQYADSTSVGHDTYNTAIGYEALGGSPDSIYNNTGIRNTAVGDGALKLTTGGSFNTAMGSETLINNYNGINNTAIGHAAMKNNYSSQNTALGQGAGENNLFGRGNVFLGAQAGQFEVGSNKLYINNNGSSSDSVLIYGEFDSKRLFFNARTEVNERTVDAFAHAFIGKKEIPAGSNIDAFGVLGQNDGDDFYGYGVFGSGGYMGVRGRVIPVVNGQGTYYGVFGSATSSDSTSGAHYGVYGEAANGVSSFAVYAAGDMAYTGMLIDASDRKLKTNVESIKGALKSIEKLNPTKYLLKDTYQRQMNMGSKPEYGFIAQEIQQVFPNLVQKAVHPGAQKTDAPIEFLGVNYIGMIPVLTKGIQEQQEEIKELKAQLNVQENRILKLEAALEKLLGGE